MYVDHELFYEDEDIANVNGYPDVSVLGIPLALRFDEADYPAIIEHTQREFKTLRFQLLHGRVEYNKANEEHRSLYLQSLEMAGYPRPVPKTGFAAMYPTKADIQKMIEEVFLEGTSPLVEDIPRMKNYVKTKLLIETAGEKASDRIRALESMGKLSELGMFADKMEISVENKSTEEIRQELNDRLAKYMGKVDVLKPAIASKREAMIIDLDEELGLSKPKNQEGTASE
jgi:hypothetical protein